MSDPNDLPNDLMKPGAAAELLGVHLASIYRWMGDGTLPYYRLAGRQRRISRRDAVGLVQAEKIEAPPERRARRQGERKEAAHEREKAARRDLDTLRAAGLDRFL